MKNILSGARISDVRNIAPYHAQVVVEPLERGYGHTLGNALRRVMLSSIPGFAPTRLKIDGVMHEYDHIDGVREDVIWIVLNVKGIVFKIHDAQSAIVTLDKSGPAAVRAGDLKLPQNVEVLNPEHEIAHLDQNSNLSFELTVESGIGYQPAPERDLRPDNSVGLIYLDAAYSPIKKVSFNVESARVETRTDLDKLTFDIETNGAFEVVDILRYAANLMIDQLSMLTSSDNSSLIDMGSTTQVDETVSTFYSQNIDVLGLTIRALNCLRQDNINFIGDLVSTEERTLMKIANLGQKSLTEIKQALAAHGLTLGMNIDSWRAPNY